MFRFVPSTLLADADLQKVCVEKTALDEGSEDEPARTTDMLLDYLCDDVSRPHANNDHSIQCNDIQCTEIGSDDVLESFSHVSPQMLND